MISFVHQLIDTPYIHHPLNTPFPASNTAPFWNVSKPPPPIDTIRTTGICCAGLANLARRFCGLPIPHPPPVQDPGGTLAWFHHLDQQNILIPLPHATRPTAIAALPRGTLLIEPYSAKTQGHLAILLTPDRLIHAFPPKVSIDPPTPRYTHACLPGNWLLPQTHTHPPHPLLHRMSEHSITDNPGTSGTPAEIQDWLISSGAHPYIIRSIWLDPITDELRCTVAPHTTNLYGEPVAGFTIVPADGATFSADGWQPFGDPMPVWPYPGRAAIPHPDRPAPAYYQPMIIPVQHRSTHVSGTLTWVSSNSPQGAYHRPRGDPLRLVHPSLLDTIHGTVGSLDRKSIVTNGPIPHDYDVLRVAARAPPWHPNCGHFLLIPPSQTQPQHQQQAPQPTASQ